MLRKRSRAVTSNKSTLMADKHIRPISSFFNSPRFFSGFSAIGSPETESMMSPTSILDTKPFSVLGNVKPSLDFRPNHPFEKKLDSRGVGVGLGIVDALNDQETNKKFSKSDSRMVLFGSQLKIQIPLLPPSALLSPSESPKSPDFGIKTRNSQLGLFSPCSTKKSPFGSSNSGLETPNSPQVFTGCLSASEMELSEDYTCVIARGPNPRTTHIYGDCIVENCCGGSGFSLSKKDNCFSVDQSSYLNENFLSFCYNCKKKLEQGKDIYMYRGEKAFCSHECRYQEIMFDEGMEKPNMDNSFRTPS